jgi:hypothetical protein
MIIMEKEDWDMLRKTNNLSACVHRTASDGANFHCLTLKRELHRILQIVEHISSAMLLGVCCEDPCSTGEETAGHMG